MILFDDKAIATLAAAILKDEEFERWAKRILKKEDVRILGLKAKTHSRNAPIIPDRTLKLEGWF